MAVAPRLTFRDRLALAGAALRGKTSALPAPVFPSTRLTQVQEAPRPSEAEYADFFKQSPWLHAVIVRIAQDVAAAKWRLYRKGAVRERKWERGAWIEKAVPQLSEIETHPFVELYTTVNPWMTSYDFRYLLQVWLELHGEAGVLLVPNGLGLPAEMWPVPPGWFAIKRSDENPLIVSEFIIRPARGSRLVGEMHVPAANFLWFRIPDPANPYGRGLGNAAAVIEEAQGDLYARRRNVTFFHNNAMPPFIIGFEPPEGVSGHDASEDEAKRFEETWKRKYGSRWERDWVPAFIAAKVTVQKLQDTMKDMDFANLRDISKKAQIAGFGVPLALIGLSEDFNKANMDGARQIYAENVLRPRLAFQAETVSEFLLQKWDEKLVMQFDDPVPESRELRLQEVNTGVMGGYVRASEARGAMGWPDDPDAAVYLPPFSAIPTPSYRGAGREPVEDAERGLKVQRLDTKADDPLDEMEERRRLEEALRAIVARIVEAGGRNGSTQAGSQFDLQDPRVVEFIRSKLIRLSFLVTEETMRTLRETLAEGVGRGETIRELADRVNQIFNFAKDHRAVRIARTETISAYNHGTLSAWEQANVPEKTWLTARDAKVRESHQVMEGETKPTSVVFSNGLLYPGDPSGPVEEIVQCFPGETLGYSPSALLAVTRRWYVGVLVEITTQRGHRLSGTPNHPVLTPFGWKALGMLVEGEDVLSGGPQEWPVSSNPDIQQRPTALGEEFLAQSKARDILSVSGRVMDFHGDGRDGDVDIVPSYRMLQDRFQPASPQPSSETALLLTNMSEPPLSRQGLTNQPAFGAGFAADSGMRSPRPQEALNPTRAAHASKHAAATIARYDARGEETPPDRRAAYPVPLGQGEFAFSGRVTPKQVSSGDGLPFLEDGTTPPVRVHAVLAQEEAQASRASVVHFRDGANGQSLSVQADRIVKVQHLMFRGHVFNLHTASGWYVANGIIAHNCRCTIVVPRPLTEEQRVTVWRGFDRDVTRLEAEMVRTLKRHFQGMQNRALDVLRA